MELAWLTSVGIIGGPKGSLIASSNLEDTVVFVFFLIRGQNKKQGSKGLKRKWKLKSTRCRNLAGMRGRERV